jgi:FixJ family two-component response regulator
MKGGAIEFLTKPFRDQDLLDAVETGLARDRVHREQNKALRLLLRTRFESLSLANVKSQSRGR